MKQVEVTILGQVYVLGCPEGGEALLGTAVASVDREMTSIRESGKVKARERIAVLAALNMAYQLAERGAERHAEQAAEKAAERTVDHNPAQAGDAPGSNSRIDVPALLQRIDNALGDDGKLL